MKTEQSSHDLYYRLGVPVKLTGAPGLRSHDSRRWQNNPHLSVSLVYLRDSLTYLASRNIHFYRMSGQLAPYLTHPGLPQFHDQLAECATELAAAGDVARQLRIRLTMHPAFYIQLASPDSMRIERSIIELEAANNLMDAMGLGSESVIVIHVGGHFEQKQLSLQRFVSHLCSLPVATRSRLVLENDDRYYGIEDMLWIHGHTGIRLVLDILHHRCFNPTGIPMSEALSLALATWPADQRPKIHFSSPRTEARIIYRDRQPRLQMPLTNQHSDFINPFEFIELMQHASKSRLRPFDIMLEAKAKDLALLRLREQMTQYAPALTQKFEFNRLDI